MNSRPKDPKTARNKNVLVIGGRFRQDPLLAEAEPDADAQLLCGDRPKGTILVECGKMLQRGTPKLGKDGKP